MMEGFARHLLGGRHAMSPVGILALVAAALGWVVCLPILRKGLTDVRRIPGGVWRITGYRNRKSWRMRMIGGYVLGGWPGGFVVWMWRRSEERQTLRDEWHLLIEERRARHEIVLAHYEDEPEDEDVAR
jgi:hypothetical protein